MPLLDVQDLRVSFHTRHGVVRAVRGVSFALEKGETLGIVGESGSGKSVTCYSLLRLLPQPPARIESGRAMLDGVDLLSCSDRELRSVRGRRISMVFQDPMTSLNPYLRIEDQLIEPLRIHEGMGRTEARRRAVRSLEEVGVPDAASRMRAYPHQFSGGMRQRVMIAMALITRPELLIADEPTTALDVTVQAQILELIRQRQQQLGTAVLWISHDLGVIASLCRRVLEVVYAGRIVESAPTRAIFKEPRHPYNRALQQSIPALQERAQNFVRFPGCHPICQRPFEGAPLPPAVSLGKTNARPRMSFSRLPRLGTRRRAYACRMGLLSYEREAFLQLHDVKTHFPVETGIIFRRHLGTVKAVDGVSFALARGEILGLVGESGCGKSTLGRTILQLIPPTSGTVVLGGKTLTALDAAELRRARADFQMIFQDPYASLNPRMTVFDTLAEAITAHRKVPGMELPGRVTALMQKVGLAPRLMRKYPHEFSGGQRQRIAIARALAVEPKLIVADEPVSALDVSIQAQIINLLAKLSREMEMALIFISHDLSVVRHISERIAVMYLGRVVELGPAVDVFEKSLHPYTRALISAIPAPDPDHERQREQILLAGDPPSPINPPAGCAFHPRCPHAQEKCRLGVPLLEEFRPGHAAACVRVREIG